MTIDHFLSFWSQHNTVIIESLVALIVVMALFLGYRSFMGKKDDDSSGLSGGVDTAQLEKTLQKILDNQASSKGSADLDIEVSLDEESGGEASEAAAAEVAKLKAALSESRKKVEAMQTQLKEAQDQAAAASAGGGATEGGADSGLSAKEREDLSAKIKDLEARLAEYEIISEDIADLSRYREENDELRKEITSLKSGGGDAPPAASGSVAAPAEEPAAAPVVETPVAEEVPAETPAAPEAPAEPPAEAPVAETEQPVGEPESAAGSDLIDDDLMKEFAAAVEGQQKELENAAAKAGTGSEEAKSEGEETSQLMSEFEDFVSKKS